MGGTAAGPLGTTNHTWLRSRLPVPQTLAMLWPLCRMATTMPACLSLSGWPRSSGMAMPNTESSTAAMQKSSRCARASEQAAPQRRVARASCSHSQRSSRSARTARALRAAAPPTSRPSPSSPQRSPLPGDPASLSVRVAYGADWSADPNTMLAMNPTPMNPKYLLVRRG